ncbi:MAG: heme lyase CcmF/NrfE family subunit [Parvularculaceae bacterium]
MLAEFGQIALILALMTAVVQGVAPMAGAATGDGALVRFGRAAAGAQFLFIVAAFGALTFLHATSDFSVANVFENSHSDKPFVYKLTGVWGNHEGSMLLWVLILAGFGAAFAASRQPGLTPELAARTSSIQGVVAAAFLGFVIFTSNPFARLFPAPDEGRDLNPLLQDPGLAIHPPFLYLGYVGFSIVFAMAIAGLIGGRIDEAWARAARPWALASRAFLTIGIGLGAWWAYYELGWGGFWAWDPVENASFLPWLAGVALIHSVRVTEVRGAFKAWTALLAILAFSLSLVGTFLVRSGVLTSVHAFAVDPARGAYILLILAAAVGGGLALFAFRAPALSTAARFDAVSREGGLLVNNLLLVSACAVVFIGTFYPLFVEAAVGEKLSVGAPYFNLAFTPFVFVSLAMIAPATAIAWKRGDLPATLRRLWPALAAAAAACLVALALAAPKTIAATLGTGLAVWAGAGVLLDAARRVRPRAPGALDRLRALPRSYAAMTFGHVGLAVVAVGVIGSGVWLSEEIAYVEPGGSIAVGGYEARLDAVEPLQGPNYEAAVASFTILKNERTVRRMTAERRFYPVRGMATTEAGVWTTLAGDLYLTLGERNAERGWVVRAWRRPLTVWMWIGAGLIAFGGLIGAFGAPRLAALARGRRTTPAGAEASA